MSRNFRFGVFVLLLVSIALPLSAQERPAPLPAPSNAVRAVDEIINGGFEVDANWTETSLTFPNDIICTVVGCGTRGDTAGPRTGTGWVWFGGGSQEASRIAQSLDVTPAAGTTDVLSFYVWNGTATRGRDSFYVRYNDLQLFEIREGDQPYASGYAPVLLNLTGISSGALSFNATSMDGRTTNFSLDDVSLIPNVQDLVVNGSFEDGVDALAPWTAPGKSGDKVVCAGAPFGGCAYQFKGSDTENSTLRQVLQLPSGGSMVPGSTLVGSFWAPIRLGTTLRTTLIVTYTDGTKQKAKLNSSFSATHDDSVPLAGTIPPFELQQLPPMFLDKSSTKGAVLKITHTSLNKNLAFLVDNVSVAYIPAP